MVRAWRNLVVLGLMVVTAAAAAGLQASDIVASTREPDARDIDRRVYGMPAAEVFREDYAGPPVVGDAVTLLPYLAPLAPGNRTHDIRIDVLAQRIEVAPGVRYNAWTFGGTVPGPVIHVREGDRIVFTMKNRSDEVVSISHPAQGEDGFFANLIGTHHESSEGMVSPMAHSIDFHAAMVAPDDKYRMLRAGESIRFEWVANYPGIYTYHCGVPPALHHIAMGQYGIVVVSPRDGYATDTRVTREYAVVQSEFYLKRRDHGEDDLYVLDREATERKVPSHVVFNGHVNALKNQPLTANAGEWVRLYVHNVGPSDGASTHVVGTILDRVWYEGNPLNEWRGMQTVPLGASNGAVIEFLVPEEGEYILVDHEFADAQKGAVGRIRVGSRTGEHSRRRWSTERRLRSVFQRARHHQRQGSLGLHHFDHAHVAASGESDSHFQDSRQFAISHD
jgi:nitrite reductase (NO-forming)